MTKEQVYGAAQAISEASRGRLGGGFMLFDGHDMSGGAWYSAGSRPDMGGCIRVSVSSGSVTIDEARKIVLEVLAARADD